MEENSSTTELAFLGELRRHRAELRESMSALEDALAAPATTDQVALGATSSRPLWWRSRATSGRTSRITEGPTGLYREVLATSPRLSGTVEAPHARTPADQRSGREALGPRGRPPDGVADVDGVRGPGTVLLGRLVRHRQHGSDLVFEAYEFDIGGET